ncbi:hypothetical protein BJ912DRAFT_983597 [Pholiota molesta]|nr:hypothetical protein BJ912DRAFT_983597 [Pholiota molesta]
MYYSRIHAMSQILSLFGASTFYTASLHVSFFLSHSSLFFSCAPRTQAFFFFFRSWFTGYHAISCTYSLSFRSALLVSVSAYLSSYHRNNPRTSYLSLTLTMLTILEISF